VRKERQAKYAFPLLTEFPEEGEKLFEIIDETIEGFLKTGQKKWSCGKFPSLSNALIYSFFSLLDEDGEYHHFLTPRKKPNKLGEGSEATLIVGYELQKDNEGWCLAQDALPSIVLKIYHYQYEDQSRYDYRVNRMNTLVSEKSQQIEIMAKYYDQKFLFKNPYVRPLENSFKIYVPMIYWPGKEAFMIRLEFEEIRNNKYSEDTQKAAYQNLFLKSLRCGVKIIEAVEKLHEKGYLHRDIKPENFLVHEGEATLVDFGSAVLASDKNPFLGAFTPHYAPREVLDGGQWTVDAEKFSLGMTLHFLLFGIDTLNPYDCMSPEFHDGVNAGIVRINPDFLDFLKWIAKDESEKALLKNVKKSLSDKIYALTSQDPTQRPALSEVKAVFQSVLSRLERPRLQKSNSSLFLKCEELEEPSGQNLRSTPSPQPKI
jgi:serine/threonine protein kinase